ncbi:hypothetical protein JJB07_13380 [Tumebacillus sp. ITR2]|uniref:Uncharacterized protein n=1 Tax=Tumebacillus amylolyticus TaxID=2801339 RepID=A0ABS1JBJ4_9BACL|nr:hypothetical protein [Tumebacillus amylolyticus]MBL0387626.1 hypothetical protein [Tumebacillus amylolyticus]
MNKLAKFRLTLLVALTLVGGAVYTEIAQADAHSVYLAVDVDLPPCH